MDDELADILQAPPDPEFPYVYRGTATHINKFGIVNPDALERVVRVVTGLRQEMFRRNSIPGQFDLDHLCAIHHFLFQDVFEWAGQVRIIEFNRNGISAPLAELRTAHLDPTVTKQSGPPFGRLDSIVADSNRIFAELKAEDLLRGLPFPQYVERLAYYVREIYHIHPFRDGNGRSTRNFLWQLAGESGYVFDMDNAPQIERHITAYVAHSGDMEPLIELVRQSLSKKS